MHIRKIQKRGIRSKAKTFIIFKKALGIMEILNSRAII